MNHQVGDGQAHPMQDLTHDRNTAKVTPIGGQKRSSSRFCIKSTCGRVTCCLFILFVVLALIFVILIFGVFKKPTVEYLGVRGTPEFSLNDGATTLGINFIADLQVTNPNPVGIDVESILSTVTCGRPLFN